MLGSKQTPAIIRQGARKPKEGEGHLYLHGEEWFTNQGAAQYSRCLKQVDRNFVFRAKGHPDVKGQVQMSFWTDPASGLREILLLIPKGQYGQLAKGVAYTIHPVNNVAGFRWKMKEGLTVTRELSLEEKLEALEERVKKLEQRLQEVEKKK